MTFFNPEAIGVFGLIVTVFCFGLEQLGFGVKGGDHKEIGKSLAYIAIVFGGAAQIFTALSLYILNVAGDKSIFLGTIFANYGLFWVVIGWFFLRGGDKKQIAHFFIGQLFISASFVYIAIAKFNLMWPLGVVLILICGLFIALVPAWYGKGAIWTKIAGAINVAIGICSVPLFLHALGA